MTFKVKVGLKIVTFLKFIFSAKELISKYNLQFENNIDRYFLKQD